MPRKELDTIEILRQVLGFLRPEMRGVATKIVNVLPTGVKHPIVGRLLGLFAQKVEEVDIKGLQEILSDVLEMISDEIVNEATNLERKKELGELKELKKLLENARERLQRAEDMEQEKEKILQELTAFKEIIRAMKQIEEIFVPEEKKKEIKIDWNKIFQKIDAAYKIIKETATEKIIPELKKVFTEVYTETKGTIKKLDQKASRAARKVKKWPRPF